MKPQKNVVESEKQKANLLLLQVILLDTMFEGLDPESHQDLRLISFLSNFQYLSSGKNPTHLPTIQGRFVFFVSKILDLNLQVRFSG